MNKKVFNIFIVILAIVGIAYFATNREQTDTTSTNKTLVVYFSAQSHTKEVANEIADNLGAYTFEITPKELYTSDDLNWNNSSS